MFYTLRSETAGSVWYEEKNKGFCQELKLTMEIYPLPIKSKNVSQKKKIVLLLRQGRKEQHKVIQVKKVLIFITTQLKSSTVSQ